LFSASAEAVLWAGLGCLVHGLASTWAAAVQVSQVSPSPYFLFLFSVFIFCFLVYYLNSILTSILFCRFSNFDSS
jgi:hypothetical protein